jgi:hypothetical protein
MMPNAKTASGKNEPYSRSNGNSLRPVPWSHLNPSDLTQRILPKDVFHGLLCLERKRAERSKKHLLLMLIDGKCSALLNGDSVPLERIAGVLCDTIRDTDLAGWFEPNSVLGAVFTQFAEPEIGTAVRTIESRLIAKLQKVLKANQINHLQISFYSFPDVWEGEGRGRSVITTLYPDLFEVERKKRLSPDEAVYGYCWQHIGVDSSNASLHASRNHHKDDLQGAHTFPPAARWSIRCAV